MVDASSHGPRVDIYSCDSFHFFHRIVAPNATKYSAEGRIIYNIISFIINFIFIFMSPLLYISYELYGRSLVYVVKINIPNWVVKINIPNWILASFLFFSFNFDRSHLGRGHGHGSPPPRGNGSGDHPQFELEGRKVVLYHFSWAWRSLLELPIPQIEWKRGTSIVARCQKWKENSYPPAGHVGRGVEERQMVVFRDVQYHPGKPLLAPENLHIRSSPRQLGICKFSGARSGNSFRNVIL